MLSYIIKTFRGGISDESDKGVDGSFKFGSSIDIHKRNDSITGKQAMANITPAGMNDLGRWFVPSSDGTTYVFGSAGSIWARSGDGAWNFAYNDENGAIKGASEFKFSDGNNYLMWATNTSVARVLLNGSLAVPWGAGVATQDYKTTLTASDYHTMGPASGQLMIANSNNLATFDFDGNFNASAMNVRPGNIIKCLEERDDYVIMGSYRSDAAEEGYLWSWITTATNWVQKKRIPVKGVNALISAEMTLLQGGTEGELYFSDFATATPLHGIYGEGQVNPGGVTIEDGNALFGVYGGSYPGLWSYGRKRKNRPFALNYDYRLSATVAGSTVSEIGAIATIGGETLATYKTTDGSTTEYRIDSSSSTTKATAVYEGLEFDGGTPHLKKWFDSIKFTMNPLPSGTSVSAKFKLDGETAWRYAVLGDGSTTYSTAETTEVEFTLGKPGQIFEVGAELNPSSNSTPEILAITAYLSDSTYAHG